MATFQEIQALVDSRAAAKTSPVIAPVKPTNEITGLPDISAQEAMEKRRQKFEKDFSLKSADDAKQSNALMDFGKTFFMDGVPKLIKGMIGGVGRTGIGETDELAKLTEKMGYPEDAERIRRGESVQHIMDIPDSEFVNKADPPSLMRQLSNGFAEYAPASIMALRTGRVNPALFPKAGLKGILKQKIAQEIQSDVIPSVLLEIMDRDPDSPVMKQIQRGGINIPISLATVGILGTAGVAGAKILSRAKPAIKNSFLHIRQKLDLGMPIDDFERATFLQDQKLKNIFTQTRDVVKDIDVPGEGSILRPAEAKTLLLSLPNNMEGVDDALFLNAARMLLKRPDTSKKSFANKVIGGTKRFIESVNDNFVDRFAALGRAEKSIFKARGLERRRVSLSEKFQLSAGMEGKAIADTSDFQRGIVEHIIDPVGTKSYDGFNVYLLLQRIKYRVVSDPKRKKVVQRVTNEDGVLQFEWGEEATVAGLRALRKEVGDEKFTKFEVLGEEYQRFMERILQIQVESGRLSARMAKAIQSGNKFYAPFRVIKDLADIEDGILNGKYGSKSVSTTDTIIKKIEGISGEEDFFIDDILSATYDQIYKGRLLAEKNRKMVQLLEVAKLDKEGKFFSILDEGNLNKLMSLADAGETDLVLKTGKDIGKDAPNGWGVVHAFVDGEGIRIALHPDIMKSVSGMGRGQLHLFSSILRFAATPFKLGATTANIPFQAVNFIFADPPRNAILSRHGIKSGSDLFRFAFKDYPVAFATALRGNGLVPSLMGKAGKAATETLDESYNAFMRSDAFNSVVQRNLTPGAFRDLHPAKSMAEKYGRKLNILKDIAKIGSAIEETGKIVGFSRGLKEVHKKFGINSNSIDEARLLKDAKYSDAIDEMLTEVRNFGGSPDFFRGGHLSPDLNLLFMFMNARIQGTVADVGRLIGMKGRGTSDAWRRLAIAKVPGSMNYIRNKMFYQDDLDSLQENERDNYHVVFSPDQTFIKDGKLIRDAYRIPKREIEKISSNVAEAFIDFLWEREPALLGEAAMKMLQEISPLSIEITGSRGGVERSLQTAIGQSNPLLKVPVETAFQVNTFTGNPILSQTMQGIEPWKQYRDTTPEIYKWIAMKLKDSKAAPDFIKSPERLRTFVDGILGGATRQFQAFDVAEDREGTQGLMAKYGMTRRFVRSEYVNEQDIQNDLDKFTMKTNTARHDRLTWAQEWKVKWDNTKDTDEKAGMAADVARMRRGTLEEKKREEKLKQVFELESLGMSYTDTKATFAKNGSVENGEFARFIYGTIFTKYTKNTQDRAKLIKSWKEKGIVNETIDKQLNALFVKFGPPPFNKQ